MNEGMVDFMIDKIREFVKDKGKKETATVRWQTRATEFSVDSLRLIHPANYDWLIAGNESTNSLTSP